MRKAGACTDPQWECILEGLSSIWECMFCNEGLYHGPTEELLASRLKCPCWHAAVEQSTQVLRAQIKQTFTYEYQYFVLDAAFDAWTTSEAPWPQHQHDMLVLVRPQIPLWSRHSAHAIGDVTACQGDPPEDCYTHPAAWSLGSPYRKLHAWSMPGTI